MRANMDVRMLSCLALGLVLAPAGLALAQGGGSAGVPVPAGPRTFLRGFVRDTSGAPLAGAQVFAGQPATITTGADGAFRVADLPHGLLTLLVRHIGFRPSVTQWDLDGDTLSLDLRMLRVPQELPAVHVVARAQPYDGRLAGFNARLKAHTGYYITREDILKRNNREITDELRSLPGVRVYTMNGALGTSVHLAGSSCSPLVFVDGFPAVLGHFDLNQVPLDAVEGIEVYPNATTVPSEFLGPAGQEQCGVIAIWMSPMRPNPHARRGDDTVDVQKLVASGAVYLPEAVDVQAELQPASMKVAYPDSLLKAGVAARLSARFVVDVDGRVELETLKVTAPPAPPAAFVAAVSAALMASQFSPAHLNGRRVRQVVVLPFVFDPAAVAPGTGGTKGGLEGEPVAEFNGKR